MHERIAHGSVSSALGAAVFDGEVVQRVLFFGKSMSRSRCTGGLVDGLRQHGLDVKWINLAKLRRWVGRSGARALARRAFDTHAPDIVFVFCRDLPQELLVEFGARAPVVLWCEEALEHLDESTIDYMAQAHLVCLSNPARRGVLRAHGVENVAFLMSGFSPRYHAPIRARLERDVVFIGGPGPDGLRARLVAEIARHFETKVHGSREDWRPWQREFPWLRVGGPIGSVGFRKACASSRIVLGMNQFNDDPLYFSNRTFLALGSGAFHLTCYVPGLEDVFEDGQHLAWYRDVDECLSKIDGYLVSETERKRIARAGHELAMQKHQYAHRIERILQILGAYAPAPIRPVLVHPASATPATLSASR